MEKFKEQVWLANVYLKRDAQKEYLTANFA